MESGKVRVDARLKSQKLTPHLTSKFGNAWKIEVNLGGVGNLLYSAFEDRLRENVARPTAHEGHGSTGFTGYNLASSEGVAGRRRDQGVTRMTSCILLIKRFMKF